MQTSLLLWEVREARAERLTARTRRHSDYRNCPDTGPLPDFGVFLALGNRYIFLELRDVC